MATSTKPEELDRFLGQVVATVDPAERLRILRGAIDEADELGSNLRKLRGETIRALRDKGATWGTIGALLDVSPQRATQLAATR